MILYQIVFVCAVEELSRTCLNVRICSYVGAVTPSGVQNL